MDEHSGFSRRSLLGTTVAATLGGASLALRASAQTRAVGWNYETDIICVGGGAAGLTAAATAISNGDKVILLESRTYLGGTTAKSGGVHWIPNNPLLRAKGLVDEKADALAFMARLAYPEYYTPPTPDLRPAQAAL